MDGAIKSTQESRIMINLKKGKQIRLQAICLFLMAASQDCTSEMCNLTQAQRGFLANYRKINQTYSCTR